MTSQIYLVLAMGTGDGNCGLKGGLDYTSREKRNFNSLCWPGRLSAQLHWGRWTGKKGLGVRHQSAVRRGVGP